MDSKITAAMYNALKLKYQADYQEANATLLVYFNNSVGIGEHPQHLEEIDKLLENISNAEDKLESLNKHFNHLVIN